MPNDAIPPHGKREAMIDHIIDHIYLPVSDLNRSSEFYEKMLEPLGIEMPYKFGQARRRTQF